MAVLKKRILLIAAVAVLAICAGAALVLSGCEARAARRSSTDIDLELAEDGSGFSISQTFNYANNSGATLSELYFYFYPLAFSDPDKLPISETSYNEAYPQGMSVADVEIFTIGINGEPANFEEAENLAHVIKISLEKPLSKNGEITLDFSARVTLPYTTLRFGRSDASINLAQFYFQPAVFEGGEWKLYEYFSAGDPFFCETADFEVSITRSTNLKMVHTGAEVSEKVEGAKIITQIDAPNTRDFAVVFSASGKILETEAGGVEIKYLYTADKAPQESLAQAASAITSFSELFGQYDYKTFSMADVDFLHGGMEFTSLIYVTSLSAGEERERIIVHEIAHQWWYGSVGNNQVEDAWQDESLTEFSTMLYLLEAGRDESAQNLFSRNLVSYNNYGFLLRSYGVKINSSMNRSLDEFAADIEYTIMVYTKGLLMYENIYSMMGRDVFLESLQNYYEKYKGSLATPFELIECFENASRGAGKLIEKWTSGGVVISGIM